VSQRAPGAGQTVAPALDLLGPRAPPSGGLGRVRKAASAQACLHLEQLPNVGPAMAGELRSLGIHQPQELAQRDAFSLYQALCARHGKRQDPCVLDTFMAITDFMRGAAPAPWWTYTARRKQVHGTL
jgi:hypothetical protein